MMKVVNNNFNYKIVDNKNKSVITANKFLKSLVIRNLSKKTVRSYAFDLIILYRWLLDNKIELNSIEGRDLLCFIDFLQRKKMKPSSINRILSTTRNYYRFTIGKPVPMRQGVQRPRAYYKGPGKDRVLGLWSRSGPMALHLKVKSEKKLITPLATKEINNFLKLCHRYRDLSIVYLMLFCGLRSCEVLDLRLNSINFNEECIQFFGKGRKERRVPINPKALETIYKYTI